MARAIAEEVRTQQIKLRPRRPIGIEVIVSSAAQNPGEGRITLAYA